MTNPATRNARSVWTIPTQPYAGAHFATMPPALAEVCIRAGTSEHGACPDCGAPWVRVVDKGFTAHDACTQSAYGAGTTANRLALLRQAARARGEEYSNQSTSLGFIPSCQCYPNIPAAPDLPEMPDDAIAPAPCERCDGSGEIEALPMFGLDISNTCPDCQGKGGTQPNAAWVEWNAEYQVANAERVGIYESIAGLNLPVVPCIVLDPFSGSGTTAMVAVRLRRRAVGVDLKREYIDLACERATVQMELV